MCVLISAELFGDSGEGTGINLYHTEPTVQNCTFPSSIKRLKDVSGCSAAPEGFSFTPFGALFLFAVLIARARACVCLHVSKIEKRNPYDPDGAK